MSTFVNKLIAEAKNEIKHHKAKDPLVRIDWNIHAVIKEIAKDNDRTIPRQVNRILKDWIIKYQRGEINETI